MFIIMWILKRGQYICLTSLSISLRASPSDIQSSDDDITTCIEHSLFCDHFAELNSEKYSLKMDKEPKFWRE